ncbi:MAG: 5-formaminoimidazole-4-carboxamide-1-(beta)-D-ribofuranosyl 5'-monophosphate synthetase [Candidatus Nanohalarchaeota archaeon]|nr:MAG: 5-formaminoimidazole-4-carboxamide-1-(beta)-D-ribofuranosyl 5'-monophosphate synthetase [Candidatus Nanohaloarchaeota archaeon]
MKDIKIATFGSHTALQILKGAKDEGFKTIAICEKGKTSPYKIFNVADEIIEISKFSEFEKYEQMLIKKNAIIIPHGSFVSYYNLDKLKKSKIPYYGCKNILKWESDRNLERQWLLKAGIKLPKVFESPDNVDSPVIVKEYGAKGGSGYFLAQNKKDFEEKIKTKKIAKYQIQEFIVGTPVYIHYFYSPLDDKLEIMSMDKRYESNADALGRISFSDQKNMDIATSYTVVGNFPIVVRESLLHEIIRMGENVIKASKEIEFPRGTWGPFCLETILTDKLEFYVFEISARIVAGTNPFINGSSYSYLNYDVPMSTGRRIARDIKKAIELNRLKEIVE